MQIENIEIGDQVSLIEPWRGYRHAEVIGFEGVRLILELTSGATIRAYADEVEEG